MSRFAALAVVFAFAGPVQAQDASPPPVQTPPPPSSATTVAGVVVTARRPVHVAEVTVTAPDWCPTPDPVRHPAGHDPRVIDSYPAPGEAVAPGYAIVRITFDAPMSCYSEVTVEGGDDADDPCEPAATWALPARRTWIMQCRWAPQTRYKLSFRPVDGHGFVGLSGRPAEPYEIDFTTTSAPPTPSREAALLADPGAPKSGETRAYVTCTDSQAAGAARACSHQVFGHTPQ